MDKFKEAMTNVELVEYYEEDYPLPSALLFGFTLSERPLHAVVALDKENEKIWIITLYEPSLEHWKEQFKIRRS